MGAHEFIDVEDCAAYVGTCDAGHCDRETAAVVVTESDGWLSMCARHAVLTLAATVRA